MLERCWCRMKRSALIATVLLALAACTPKEPELDGAPKDTPAPSDPVADDGSLAGGGAAPATAALLPGVLDVTLPAGALVVKEGAMPTAMLAATLGLTAPAGP